MSKYEPINRFFLYEWEKDWIERHEPDPVKAKRITDRIHERYLDAYFKDNIVGIVMEQIHSICKSNKRSLELYQEVSVDIKVGIKYRHGYEFHVVSVFVTNQTTHYAVYAENKEIRWPIGTIDISEI